ncbi:MAG: 2-polyprenyl-3-methyl-5-hydroxy-6-metoxy-1,4-benzoquinol methylase [Alcanivorax sp.]|nr:2-polyprenyl-3-methyl-5-hydroxy-6-metoxy-1,4-benzoquinol methylase [Alcanivorax sp.]
MATACPLCQHPAPAHFAEAELLGRQVTYQRCPGCRLTFLSPDALPDLATEREQYDLHRNDPADRSYRAFLDRLAGPLQAELTAGAEGLDFGSGPGPTLALMLTERGFPCASYDPLYAPDQALLTRQYDFIACTEVVEHFHTPGDSFALLDRLLRPGGVLGIMTSWLMNDATFEHWHYRRDPTHVCFYKPATFQWWAQTHGYEVMLPATNIVLLRKLAKDL